MHVALEVAGMPGRLSWALNNVSLISNHVLVHQKIQCEAQAFSRDVKNTGLGLRSCFGLWS